MKIGAKTIVALRYVMKNEQGEELANIMASEPIKYLHGSGAIIPGLEDTLTGLRIGDCRSVSLTPETSPELQDTFHFNIIIDNVRWATQEELLSGSPEPESKDCSGEGCC